jgi:hypothetical protein
VAAFELKSFPSRSVTLKRWADNHGLVLVLPPTKQDAWSPLKSRTS